MKYYEKLKDPRWQKKRLQILERDGWACKLCRSTEDSLHVHHLHYFKDLEPWEVNEGFLITLCEDCHINEREAFGDDSLLGEIGELLKAIWESKYDYLDLVNLTYAIKASGTPPLAPPDEIDFELKFNLKEKK